MPEGVARAGLAHLSEPPGHPAFDSLEPMGNHADQGGGATEAGADHRRVKAVWWEIQYADSSSYTSRDEKNKPVPQVEACSTEMDFYGVWNSSSVVCHFPRTFLAR